MDGLENISRCNDIVNAISNNCKQLVRAADGSVFLLNQEGGTNREDINRDAEDCEAVMSRDVEDNTLPWVFTDKFRKDMLMSIYGMAIPGLATNRTSKEDANEAFARSLLPGLVSLKTRIRQLLAESNNDSLSSSALAAFFDDHLCENVMCVRHAVGDDIPPLNVSHPDWVYFPDSSKQYLSDMVGYIKLFLNNPVSKRCSLCDTYFKLTDSDSKIDLFGLPEQFKIDKTICSLYSRHRPVDMGNICTSLKIKRVVGEDFMVELGGKIYY